MIEEYARSLQLTNQEKTAQKKFFSKASRMKPKVLDRAFEAAHDEVFEEVDCMKCGNCCKTTSPIFRDADVERLAKYLRIKAADFMEQYIERDKDDFYVLKTAPCPFLDLEDNACTVYDARPKACREYPHTDRKNMKGILELTEKNAELCPATARIVKKLMSSL